MSEEYYHNPDTLHDDFEIVRKLKGTYNMDTPKFYDSLDNILLFVEWVIGKQDKK